MHQLHLVCSPHDDESGKRGEVSNVEGPHVGRPVGANHAGPVDREPDGQLLDRDIMDDLVVGALQERGVDGREGLIALGGQTGRESHSMLFGNADVEEAPGEPLGELAETGAVGHRRGQGDDFVVVRGLGDQCLGENRGI